MALLQAYQAETATLSGGASLTMDAQCMPSGSNNAVSLSGSGQSMSINFGSAPSGATKVLLYLKKLNPSIIAIVSVSYLGGTPQNNVLGTTVSNDSLNYLLVNTLPNIDNDTIRISGENVIIDRIEFVDETLSMGGSITVQNQLITSLVPTVAGSNNNSISLNPPSAFNCADTNSREITEIEVGIVVKKGGVTLSVGDVFLASDVLTYNVSSSITSSYGYLLFKYIAVGACGDSNEASIFANIVGVSQSIAVQNQSVGQFVTGSNGNTITLTAPTVSNCNDTNERIIAAISPFVTVKKNGLPLMGGDTFLASDSISVDVAGMVATPNYTLFQYYAVGVCGDSNTGIVSANIVQPNIMAENQTIQTLNSGATGVSFVLSTPNVFHGCSFSGVRILTGIASGVTIKKNNVAMIINNVWSSSDTITLDIAPNVPTTSLKELFRFKAVGTCGDSNEAIISANVNLIGSGIVGGGGAIIPSNIETTAQQTVLPQKKSNTKYYIITGLVILTAIIGFFSWKRNN